MEKLRKLAGKLKTKKNGKSLTLPLKRRIGAQKVNAASILQLTQHNECNAEDIVRKPKIKANSKVISINCSKGANKLHEPAERATARSR